MNRWSRRIRASFVMGLTWAAAWVVAATVLARVPGVNSDLPLAFLFAPLGFISGIIFSAVLMATEGRRQSARMSLSRFAGWGAVSGLLLSGVFVIGAALRGGAVWGEFLLFGPALATASAACAAGSLALARRGERRELPAPSGHHADAGLTEAEKQELLG